MIGIAKGGIVGFCLILGGCATSPRGFWPSGSEWRDSAARAAQSPATWVPLAGAALVAAADKDRDYSDSVAEKRPVFDSEKSARRFGDDGEAALGLIALGTALWADDGVNGTGWRLGALVLAHGAAAGTTEALKSASGRERPDGSNDKSFPSGHATHAFSYAAIASRNLDDTRLSDSARWAWGIGLYTVAGGVAWSRVEARAHFPTDVLVGAALGNFLSTWVYDAFLDERRRDVALQVQPVPDGLMLVVGTRF